MACLMVAGFVLTSCAPQKEEEAPQKESAIQPEQKEMTQPQQAPEAKPLTPQEEDELKIDEENVMETFPG